MTPKRRLGGANFEFSLRRRWLCAFLIAAAVAVAGLVFSPRIWTEICVRQIAAHFILDTDFETGESYYVVERGADFETLARWERRLRRQPIGRLLALLHSDDPLHVWIAAQALPGVDRARGRLEGDSPVRSPGAQRVIHKTIRSLQSEAVPPHVLAAVVGLMGSVQSPEALDLVKQLTQHSSARVRRVAVWQLQDDLKPANKKDGAAVPAPILAAILEFWNSALQDVRRETVQLVVRNLELFRGNPDVWEMLRRSIRDPALECQDLAVAVLQDMDLTTPEDVELVRQILESSPPATKTLALDAMFPRQNHAISPELVDLAFQNRDSGRSHGRDILLFCLTSDQVPAEQQWRYVTQCVLHPNRLQEGVLGCRMFAAVFSPPGQADVDWGFEWELDQSQWSFFRGIPQRYYRAAARRLRPDALPDKPKLLAWCREQIRSEDAEQARLGVTLTAVMAPDEPDRLTDALVHSDPQVRSQAAYCLGRTTRSKDEASGQERIVPYMRPSDGQVPILLDLLSRKPSMGVGSALANWPGEYSKSDWDRIVEFGARGGNGVNYSVWDLLRRRHVDIEVLLDFVRLELASSEPLAGEGACSHLMELGPAARELLPLLLEGVAEGRITGRATEVVRTLGLPVESVEAARRLISFELGPTETPNLPFDHPASKEVVQRFEQLLELCPVAAYAEALVDGLKHPGDLARRMSAKNLVRCPDPSALLSRIEPLLQDPRWFAREGGVIALGYLAQQQSLPLLIQKLSDEHPGVRSAAAEALGRFGSHADKAAADALVRTIETDPYPGARAAAARAYVKLGHEADRRVIARMAKDPEPLVSRIGQNALKSP